MYYLENTTVSVLIVFLYDFDGYISDNELF